MTPSKLDPIDISAKPQRPNKIYVKLLKALPENLASTATTPFTNQSNNPDESPVPLSAAVLFTLKCIHQQTGTPDETTPFTQADRAKALLRILERKHMDNEDEDDFVSANDIDTAFQYYSRYTHTSPHALLRLKTNITKVQSTLITQDWSIATTVIGYHYSNNSSKTQQSLFSFFSQKNPSSTSKNRTETSSKLKSNHKNQSKSTKKNLIEEVIGPGPTDHIKNKTKTNTSKQTSISFASSTKPPKGGSTSPPTSPEPPSKATANTSPTTTHSTSQAPPQPGAFPTDFNSWKERAEDDNDKTFLYTNKAGNTVTTTPAAIATEVVNPKSKIQIPPSIMLKALILHQTSLAQAPPPSKAHQLKSPPKTNRTDMSNPPSPFLIAAKKSKARNNKTQTKTMVPDTLIPLRIRLSLPVPDKETASNPNSHVLQTLADFMAAAQEEDPTFCYLQWNNPQEGPYISDPADMPTSLNEFKKFTQRVTPVSNKVCWMKLCIASENVDPRIFVQGGPDRSVLDHWLENNAVMSCRHAGNSKVKELIKPTVYSTTLQKSPNSVRAGEFLGIWSVMSDTNGFATELTREINEVAAIEKWGPVELGVEFSNTKIGTFDGEKGKYKWPYLSYRTLALEVNRECAARAAQFIYRRTNKVKEVTKRPWSLDCRFIPDEAFSDISASASPIWHGNMYRRHCNLTNCMAPPIYTSVIKDLHAVATIKGIQITLKDFLLHITYPY